MKRQKGRNFFIIGAQRSGTTLLRLILNSHSKIAVPEEAEFLMPVLKKKFLYTKIKKDNYQNIISLLFGDELFKQWNYDTNGLKIKLENRIEITLRDLISYIYTSYADFENKAIWGDKTPVFLRKIHILHTIFPEALFIHIVRDGRDVFNSWRKMDQTKGNVSVAAIDWTLKNWIIELQLKSITQENQILVRYEDLLENPRCTISRICAKIGVEFEDKMLAHHLNSDFYIGNHHSKLIFQPIVQNNKFKWKTTLSDSEIRIYTYLANSYLKKFKYSYKLKKPTPFDYNQIAIDLIYGIPFRLKQIYQAKSSMEIAFQKGKPIKYSSHGSQPSKSRIAKKNQELEHI